MNGRQCLFLLNCVLLSSLFDGANAQRKLSIRQGATPLKQRALQFGILENVLNNVLSDASFALPGFTFSENIPLAGAVTFSASNIQCSNVQLDNLDVSVAPQGIFEADFNLNANVRLECGMDYSIEGGLLFGPKQEGSLTLLSQDNAFDVVASLSPSGLSFSSCNFDLGTPELDFSGSVTSEILNFFEDVIVGTLDGALGNLDICGDFSSILGGSEEELMPVFEDILSERNGGGRALLEKSKVNEKDSSPKKLRVREVLP